MQTIEDRVRAKRAEVESQRSVIVRKLEELASLKLRLTALEDQVAMLDALLADTSPVSSSTANGTAADPAIGEQPPSRDTLLSPQVAVMEFLERHPEGATQMQVVDAVAGKVRTDSPNPRGVLRNTVLNLVKRHRVARNAASGVLTIVPASNS